MSQIAVRILSAVLLACLLLVGQPPIPGQADDPVFQVRDIFAGASSSYPGRFYPVPGGAFFDVSDGSSTRQLWFSNGTPEGTYPLENDPGAGVTDYSVAADGIWSGDTFYFLGQDSLHGSELWRAARTPGSAEMLMDIFPGPEGSDINSFTLAGNRLFFIATDDMHGSELWSVEPATGQPAMAKVVIPTEHEETHGFGDLIQFGNGIAFVVFDHTDPILPFGTLWKSDGTENGTQALISRPYLTLVTSTGDKVFYADGSFRGKNTLDLWVTDGTEAGSHRVDSTPEGTQYIQFSPQANSFVNGKVFFSPGSWTPQGQNQLWVTSDPYLSAVNMHISTSSMDPIGQVGGRLLFTVPAINYKDLWSSDGTPGGTLKISANFTRPAAFLPFGNTLLFSALNGSGIRQIWQTDGTSAGTHQITDITIPVCSSYDNQWTLADKSLIFPANDGTSGCELWGEEYLTHQVMLPITTR